MSVPATTTVLIFMGGVATGIILIITILLCCRIKSRHSFFQRNRGISKKSCSPNLRISSELYDRSQEVPFKKNEDIIRDELRSKILQEDVPHVEVPIINSLKEIIDRDGCPTSHFHQCNIVQIQIDSNKTFKFYSRYDTTEQNTTNNQSLDFRDRTSNNFCENPEKEVRLQTLDHVAQSVTNSLHLSPSLLKSDSSIIRSMPNVNIDLPICSDKKDCDQQSRRISFRKKLHNLKKYIDESIVENICNEPLRKSDENIYNKNGTTEKANVQEMSKELWHLRAMLADADELESEESLASTPHNDEIQNSNEPIRNEFAWSRKIFPMDILNNGAMNQSEDKNEINDLSSQLIDDVIDAKSSIQKKPSVRRQIYRNALARQQQKIMSQESNLRSEDSTNVESKRDDRLNSEDVESQPSFESKADDGHNNRLERLRGDSGYKSLENQQSLRTSFQLIIQENNLPCEDDPQPRIFAPSSNSQILTRRVHSADETLVTIPLSLLSVTDESFEASKSSHKLTDDLFVEELKVRKSSQNIDFQSKFKNHSTTSSDIVSIVKPIFCNTSLLSSTSSFASSLFSRFLRSHSRRTHTRTQRDYSIDERSDAIFNEFIRFDPTLEMRHTYSLNRTSPRSHQRLHRYKFSEKYSPIPLVSEKAGREQKLKCSKQRHLKKLSKTFSEKQAESEVYGDIERASDAPNATQSENLVEDDRKTKEISNLKHIPVIQLTEEE